MRPCRLAIVRQKYRPDGGAERFVSRALEALSSHNNHIDLNVITRQWQGERQKNWRLHICDPLKWSRISREKGFADAARSLWQREKFDLVQSHERIAGCDIYRAGDGVHRRWLQQRARILPGWRQKWLFRDSYHRYVMHSEQAMYQAPELKAIICNAEMVKREIIQEFSIPDNKIKVIYNAVNSAYFIPAQQQQREELRATLAIPKDAVVMVFVGSGFERKGLAGAIKAIARTDRYLVVVGRDKAEQDYHALARTLGCDDRVRFMGMQKNTLPFYQIADGLLLPTLYDPFPNVILEAMSCSLPVITSFTCGGAEFITSEQNGYICDALDSLKLADAVMAIPSGLVNKRMGDDARQRVINETPDKLSQQLISLYQNLLD